MAPYFLCIPSLFPVLSFTFLYLCSLFLCLYSLLFTLFPLRKKNLVEPQGSTHTPATGRSLGRTAYPVPPLRPGVTDTWPPPVGPMAVVTGTRGCREDQGGIVFYAADTLAVISVVRSSIGEPMSMYGVRFGSMLGCCSYASAGIPCCTVVACFLWSSSGG